MANGRIDDHRYVVKARRSGVYPHRKRTPLFAVAIALAVIEVFALIAVNVRLR